MAFREKKEESKDVFGIEEAMARINLELMNPTGEKVKTLSDVMPEEVFSISILLSYAHLFNSNLISNWTKDFLELRISRLRLGRREFVQLGSGMSEMAYEKRRRMGTPFEGLRA